MFKRIVIANRGEIAIRVIRACRELGIESVAIFSDADRTALHVQEADYAYCVGPPPSSESYLAVDTILAVARQAGAEAVHPGYGFLAENAAFARRCAEAGLVFIGPPPEAIEQMGDKAEARKLMQKARVPVVPGSAGVLATDDDVLAACAKIGYPVMLKAVAGGGGKGMRLVAAEANLRSALRAVRSEARSSFGDDRLYAERYIHKPRHIEMQVLADAHGNCVHLYERECSIQRRHQKVIEEAPSMAISHDVREAMGAVAVQAAKAIKYVGAGTLEFLVDPEQNFYFMEMNTRIQVEHAITEMITGVDLVKAQITIAAGDRLPFRQGDIRSRGHAIECRIYAEDPRRNFMPSPGTITSLQAPGGIGIRIDSGVYAGAEISPYYDPMIAKLLALGESRDEAIARMQRAIREYRIGGVTTNLAFHAWILQHPRFLAADFDTHFIDEEFRGLDGVSADHGAHEAAVAAAVLARHADERAAHVAVRQQPTHGLSPWQLAARRDALRR